jgi:hypothetical protein
MLEFLRKLLCNKTLLRERRFVYIGISPFNTQWLDELPFHLLEDICYEDGAWCEDISGARPFGRVVDRRLGYVYAIFWMHKEKKAYVLGFDEYRGADGHPHPTVLASWVDLHPCFFKGGDCRDSWLDD